MWGKVFESRQSWAKVLVISLVITVSSTIGIGYAGEPGSDEDPLVSQSYVDNKNADLKKQLEDVKVLADQLKTQNDALKTTVSDLSKKLESMDSNGSYEVIELKLGQRLIAKASTEMVLRSGKAKAITSEAGGLADLTADSGLDIKNGQTVPANHLLLVPRDDGRGIRVTSTNAWVMIKGKYEIKQQ